MHSIYPSVFSSDEAHKGTGNHAYAQVIRYMMTKTPHFRVLALTATPGSKPQAVQAVVDALHISHIEIRDEESPDVARYLRKKHIAKHTIAMSDEVISVRDSLAEVMMVSDIRFYLLVPEMNVILNHRLRGLSQPMIQRLFGAKLLAGNPNPVSLHPFSCTKSITTLASRRDKNGSEWAFEILSKLGTLARIMGYLVCLPASHFRNQTDALYSLRGAYHNAT